MPPPSTPRLEPGDLVRLMASSDGKAVLWTDDDASHVKPEHEVGVLDRSWTLLVIAGSTKRSHSELEFVLVLSPIGIGFVAGTYLKVVSR